MRRQPVERVLRLMQKQCARAVVPIVTKVAARRNPFRILISCMLSLRTKDSTTSAVVKRLFAVAESGAPAPPGRTGRSDTAGRAAPIRPGVTVTPQWIARVPQERLEKLIFPVGFYRTKARHLRETSAIILKDFRGRVPDTLDDLLRLPGVGRKTANLVRGLGFGIPAICVDTHVHQISNRLGWVRTTDVGATEQALEKIVPQRLWIDLNTIMVAFGQNICVPVSPWCSRCQVASFCQRIGVSRSR